MGFRRQLPSVLLALGLAGAARAADPLADLEAQHQAALAALKNPPVSGLLIIEVQPESAAAAAGMRGGDILTEYHGTRVTTLQGLAQLVADAVARDLEDAAVGKDLLARVRRGDRELILVVPRDILGLRAVEVRSGVPGPRNPPPNPRGNLAFDWKPVLAQLRADNATGPAAFRTFDHADASPDAGPAALPTEEWTGWELCTLQTEADDTLVGTVERYHLVGTVTTAASQPVPVTERSTFKFKLRLGDNKTLPAFVLEEAEARYAAPKAFSNAQIVASATRRGETLLATIGTVTGDNVLPPGAGDRHENPAPLSAIPQAALPWVAAALPQSQGDALGLYLLSVRDLFSRPGYVLATCGKQPLPVDPAATAPTTVPATTRAAAPTAWRVDLMLCGVVIESYWFNDQRRLLCVQTSGPQSIVARRVDNAQTAALPLERKPAPKNPPH